ncbi:hypothetical protein RIF29_10537 [Crotalaria pallida]|uniref:Uncharacterized protein n=1 Tax=Crotalaria pallida TaxID=3830 RepID=A0AAN9FSV0_CROPI
MEKVVEEDLEKVKRENVETYSKTQEHINAIADYGKKSKENNNSNNNISLARLNGIAQDSLQFLSSLIFKLDLIPPHLPTHQHVQSAQSLLQSWKTLSHNFGLSLRNANLQAKANMRKTAQEVDMFLTALRNILLFCLNVILFNVSSSVFRFLHSLCPNRELLLGCGKESTIRRRNLRRLNGAQARSALTVDVHTESALYDAASRCLEQGDTRNWLLLVFPCRSLCCFEADWDTYLAAEGY